MLRQRKEKAVQKKKDLDSNRDKNVKISIKQSSLKPKVNINILSQSQDELYKRCEEIEKLRKKESRNRLQIVKAAKNVQSSTPTQVRGSKTLKKTNSDKKDFFLEISPIRRSTTSAEISSLGVDSHQMIPDNSSIFSDADSINRDTTCVRELRQMIADFENRKNQPKPLLSVENEIPSKVDIPMKHKKSVHINVLANNKENKAKESLLTLKPGKWRKSLALWRKSHGHALNKRKSVKFVALLPVKTDPGVIKRYTERFTESLANGSLLLEKSDEGQLQSALSLLDSSVECTSFNEPTTFVQYPQRKRETSVIKRTSIFYGLASSSSQLIHEVNVITNSSARQILLRRCGQQEPLNFDEVYSESELPNCKKIGEGVYGEVFKYSSNDNTPTVLKIIPIEGDIIVNGEQQKRFDEILQEVVISMELSGLRHGKENVTDGFVNVKRVTCVKGSYPQHLIEQWEIYNDSHLKGSENDHPEIFGEDQLYIVFELCNAGVDLEAFQFKQAEEAFSVFLQVALTLAVAEEKFQFEHRDLHWGNVLIARTTSKFAEYRVDGKVIKIPTHGVKATIIDYTLSRMYYDDAVLYNNLADDEELFSADGDYQFDIYRLMRDRLDNDFKCFEPFTNLLWLHYLIDKLIDGARYKYSKSEKHKSAINKMMKLRDDLLIDYQSASEYAAKI